MEGGGSVEGSIPGSRPVDHPAHPEGHTTYTHTHNGDIGSLMVLLPKKAKIIMPSDEPPVA